MTNNWAYNLDMLAQNGVIDYDAPSFIMGQNPRYVGRPSAPPLPYVGQVPKAPNVNQPEIDEFKPSSNNKPKSEDKDNNIVKNSSWKKWLFGGLAAGALILGAFKFKSTIFPFFKNLYSKISSVNIKDFFKNGWDKCKAGFRKVSTWVTDGFETVKKWCILGWNKLKGLFKKP